MRLLNKISNTIIKKNTQVKNQIRPNSHRPTVKGTVGILRRVIDVGTGESLCLLPFVFAGPETSA